MRRIGLGHCWRAVGTASDTSGCIAGDAFAENSNTINITDTTADTTSSVTQGTCILQSSNSHPAIDKRETRVDVQSGMVL